MNQHQQQTVTMPANAAIWSRIVIVFLAGSIATALVPLMVPILGPISAEFGIRGTQLGWVVSIPSLICAVGALALGIVVDRAGDVRILVAGTILCILGDVGVVLAPQASWLFAARLFQGIGYVSLTVAGPAFIQRTTLGETRRAAMAFWASHTPMGFAMAVFCGAQLIAAGLSWRYSFVAHGLAAIAIGVALATLRRSQSAATVSRSAGTREVVSSPRAYLIAAGACAAALLQTGVMVSVPKLFAARFALSGPHSALVVVAAMTASWLGAMIIVATRVRDFPKFVLPASALAAALLVRGLLSQSLGAFELALAFVLMFSALIGLANSLIWSLMPAAVPMPEASGATAGLITQGSFLGVLLGPPVFFWVSQQSSITTDALLVILVLLMLAPLQVVHANRARPRP